MEQNIASLISDTPCTEDSNFMGFDATGTYHLPLRSWRQAQQFPANRIEIGGSVVEISAIEQNMASLRSDTPCTEDSDFMGFDPTGTYLIPLRSRFQAQQYPSIRYRIRAVAVEGSAIEFWDRQGINKGNSHKRGRVPRR